MTTLLVNNIHTLVVVDSTHCEISNGALLIYDHVIGQLGTTAELPQTADETLDLQGRHIVLPGSANAHHHFFQTKTIPAAQNSNPFGWLKTLFAIGANLSAVSSNIMGVKTGRRSRCSLRAPHRSYWT
jgi:8-oxoguanine deaminase